MDELTKAVLAYDTARSSNGGTKDRQSNHDIYSVALRGLRHILANQVDVPRYFLDTVWRARSIMFILS